MSSDSSPESDYAASFRPHKPRLRKRLKRMDFKSVEPDIVAFPLQPLISALWKYRTNEEDSFDKFIDPLLDDFTQARIAQEKETLEMDDEGKVTRPLRRAEVNSYINDLTSQDSLSTAQVILLRKLKLGRERKRSGVNGANVVAPNGPLTPIPTQPPKLPIHPEVLEALNAITTTPFSQSFLSRLHGTKEYIPPGLLAVDWETQTPWMDLMADIHAHYSLAHPDRECPVESRAPITYSTLHHTQLPQIHDLLERSFWAGIDVTDSLDYMPERCTVIAMYKRIVVGVAIIMSPIQTYITYLAVKAGWDKAQIARNMLYHLIVLNPTRDFMLHVSTNSSAMLLYNQFGFKAEEFVAGFYAEYLDPDSRASKNAFMLRLRHI